MTDIQIELKRTGFPVKIGEVELWFDTSQESLMRFYDMEEELKRRLIQYELYVVTANIDNKIERDGVTKEVVAGAIELEKKQLEIQYDLIFGDGTFDKLYSVYPDYNALNNALEQASIMLHDKLKEVAEQHKTVVKERASHYLNKGKVTQIKNNKDKKKHKKDKKKHKKNKKK